MKLILFISVGLLLLGCTSKKNKYCKFENEFVNREQIFKINIYKDTVLIGEQGTQIRIPETFLLENLSERDTLKVILKEYYNISDMILAGLSTISNNRIIETKGMINLMFYRNNKMIDKLEKAIDIKFNNSIDNDYRIFYGNFSSNIINWELDTLTQNYHIYYNFVVRGRNSGRDIGFDTIRKDSIPWKKYYTTIDSIITFTDSFDTIRFTDIRYLENSLLKQDSDINIFYRINKLNWINIDKFINDSIYTDIKVYPNLKGDRYYYLIFNDIKSIIQNSAKNKFINVPVGRSAKMVSIDKIGDKFYFGMTSDFKIEKDSEIPIKMDLMDKEIIKQQILKLDQ